MWRSARAGTASGGPGTPLPAPTSASAACTASIPCGVTTSSLSTYCETLQKQQQLALLQEACICTTSFAAHCYCKIVQKICLSPSFKHCLAHTFSRLARCCILQNHEQLALRYQSGMHRVQHCLQFNATGGKQKNGGGTCMPFDGAGQGLLREQTAPSGCRAGPEQQWLLRTLS